MVLFYRYESQDCIIVRYHSEHLLNIKGPLPCSYATQRSSHSLLYIPDLFSFRQDI